MATAVFVTRCRICGAELETPWGPETHSMSEAALRDHLERHLLPELRRFVFRVHGLGESGA